MHSFDNIPDHGETLDIGFGGGGSAGKIARGYKDAVEAGKVPGVTNANVFVFVTDADDGGATGWLRKQYDDEDNNLPAVGDAGRAMCDLSYCTDAAIDFDRRLPAGATPELVQKIGDQMLATLSYSDQPERINQNHATAIITKAVDLSRDIVGRDAEGLKGLAFRHLALAALTIESDIDVACQEVGDMMLVRGDVIPVSLKSHYLKLRDGDEIILGEHNIDSAYTLKHPDDFEVSLYTEPDGSSTGVPANPRLLKRLSETDEVVLGPGSVLTSTIPAMLAEGIPEELRSVSEAKNRELFLLGNIKLKEETKGWTVTKFGDEHSKVIGRSLNAVICNNDIEGVANPVVFDEATLATDGMRYQIVPKPLRKHIRVTYQAGDALAATRSDVEHDMEVAAKAMHEVRSGKVPVAA